MFIFQMPSKIMAGDSCLNSLEEEIQKLRAEKVKPLAREAKSPFLQS